IGSEIQFLKSKSDFESSQKMVEQMKDRLAKTKIYAPFEGEIDEIISNQGSNLIPGISQILRLVNLDKIYAEASVSEKYIAYIDQGTDVIVQVPLLGKEIVSKIIQTGNFINPSNRTFRVEVPIENIDNKIKQNLDAKIKINIYSKQDAVVIPLRIVREDASGENFVYVMTEDAKDEVYITTKTFISLGNKNSTEVEVTDGLKIGDVLVLEGANIVEDSQRVKIIN
ncbi:efflux RND transporter periplasmic adaptor subunit, partial [Flavobacteriaceae bacterium]|nr:efflux RND transporter periplasmic adaptor subunit [Flavobacteriaceae bacterium]